MSDQKIKNFKKNVNKLAARYSEIKLIVDLWGIPKYWYREPSFKSLVAIVIEQQISTIAAKTIFNNLEKHINEISTEAVISLGIEGLMHNGLSKKKSFCCYNLAKLISNKKLNLSKLDHDSDEEVLKKLTKIPGIGPWTASMYMLSAMERIDIWPSTDLGLINGSKDLIENRIIDQSLDLGMRWSPLRSIAARLIWHHYNKKINS
jgi:DNA-3-methyladenine glycosylase II|tara:strand:- start:15934 stop:16548 length:615 start_codon:yes stop_codon:yes gene_type:complete